MPWSVARCNSRPAGRIPSGKGRDGSHNLPMNSIFRQVALIGKYHAAVASPVAASTRSALEDIANFLASQGCEVVVEHDTAAHMGLTGYATADVAGIGERCDLGLVVGG